MAATLNVFTVALSAIIFTTLVVAACILGLQDNGGKDKGRETLYYLLLSVGVVMLIVSLIIAYYGVTNRGYVEKSRALLSSLNRAPNAVKNRAINFGVGVTQGAREAAKRI